MSKIDKVLLASGEMAIVDRSDRFLVSQYNWTHGGTNNAYALSILRDGRRTETIYLHRLVMGAGSNDVVDHINGNPLDCRKENLRFVTPSQNSANRKHTRNTTGYRGVSFFPKQGKYRARLVKDGGAYTGPLRKTAIAAAKDYDKLARGIFGEYGTYNFPEKGERPVIPLNPREDE